ncbi:uncharacterized protein LOC125810967 [Solanum verrucosum]|uniref:uncharacterized protein LOC125810967 n=1 Tax=Solanum verrucosum TaxID=315347 RepID=UPI0020D1DD6E|nr:uncharacterized protein LOC125810967 [Solanum verrucosum]
MAGDGLKPGFPSGAVAETPYAAAKTSVWWDIENCQVPRGCDAHGIAQNINKALMNMNYHGPVTISAYGDSNGIPSFIQRALSNTGIALNHVPAGVKDASDKKILVDMLFWAVDNPAPANYMLISGSADFSYAIHQLRMRRYNILLAQPFNNASPALAAAATNVWQWTTLAAGKSQRELAFRNTNTLRQYYIPIPISKPTSANQPAYSNANANTSKAQSLYNPGRYFDTPKTIYIPKNSNQLTTTSMSGTPAIVEEASSSNYPRAPDVAPVMFAPHLFFTTDRSEKHNSKIEEASSSCCPRSPTVEQHLLFAKSDSSNVKLVDFFPSRFFKNMESAQLKKVIAGAVQIQPLQVSRAMAGDGLMPGFSRGTTAKSPYAAAKTSVWWDIENCQVPRGCDAHGIAQSINAALMKMNYHGPVTISAYGDTNIIPSSIQGALSTTGISLNHVPAVTKDASDKKILVDMIFWAVDNPAPANYLLISGDGDFSNAIHQLRMRKYNILLAQPVYASPALAVAATNVWQWTSLAAGGSPRGLPFRTNTLPQNYIPTPISKPISANQPAYSNTNTNANASRAQSLSNPGCYFDTKTKAIYVTKNSNQLTMTGMSSRPAIVEETSSSYCPRAPVQFVPHLFFTKSDSSENHNSKFIENKPAQRTQLQPFLVPDNFVKLNSCQDNLRPPLQRPEGRGDLCGSMNKGDIRPEFSFLPPSSGVSKSVCGNLDLDLQLPEHIQSLIRVIFNSLNTLRFEKILPTKENLGYCICYSNPEYRHTDVTVALNTALEQQMILKLGLVNFELYVGRTARIWKCVNPLGGNPNHYKDATWNAIEEFLCSTVGHSTIAASECRYEAALILRNACLKSLTLAEVLQILNMIITLKGWIKTHSEWQPITITLPTTNNDKDTRTVSGRTGAETDFSNAIDQLRISRYNIILAQPFKVSPALAAGATNVWQWTILAAGGSP